MSNTKTAHQASTHAMLQELQTMGVIAGGFVLGKIAQNTINKVAKIDPATETGIKKFLAPAAALGGGVFAGAKYGKNEHIKQLATGVAISGAVEGLKVLAPKASFLNGELNGTEVLGLTPMSALANSERWFAREEPLPMGFMENNELSSPYDAPELLGINPPQNGSGYYEDAPAYLFGEADEQLPFNGTTELL